MNKLSTQELYDKYCTKKEHTEKVCRIVLMIFNEVNNKIKKMSEKEREFLLSASMLHDIGYSIKEENHNKYSQKLITEEGLSEFTDRETAIISCISRYHRGDLPDKNEHKIYCDLDKQERKIVKQLGGILKIADCLEDDDIGNIENIEINYNSEDMIAEIIVFGKNPKYKPDIKHIIRKKNLFEIGYKTQTIIRYRKRK